MKKDIRTNKNRIAVISIIFIVVLLMISNVAKSAVTIFHDIEYMDKTNDLAYKVVAAPEQFVKYTPGQLFVMNARQNGAGYGYGDESGGLRYKRTICIYHNQATGTGSVVVKTGNIIDIEAPGKVVVYKFESLEKSTPGLVGTITQSGNTVTEVVNISIARVMVPYAVKYTKKELSLTDAQMKDFAAAAYVANKEVDTAESSNETGNEAAMDWLWKERLKDYVAAQNVLNSHFNVSFTGLDAALEGGEQLDDMKEAFAATQNLTTETVNLTKGDTTPRIYYVEDKAYIGPLQVEYTAGATTSLIVKGTSGNIIAKWATKIESDDSIAFNDEQEGNVTPGIKVYAVVDKAQIEGLETADITLNLTHTGNTSYKARLLLSYSELANAQHLMHFAGIENKKVTTKQVSWTAELNEVSLTLQKKDSTGTTLLPYAQFELYDENKNKIADITTNDSGNAVKNQLELNKTYILKEKANSNYGYRNMTVTNATISGGTITKIDAENREVTFILTENGTIIINNQPELGEIIIHKKDGEKNLAGVEFVVYRHNGYMKIDGVTTITGELTVDPNKVTYVTDIKEATKFITDSLGKVVISNLEIYSGLNTKYNYYVYEVSNNLYGYKHMTMVDEDIAVTGATDVEKRLDSRGVKFSISNSTTVIMNNTQILGNLTIDKKGEDNLPLAGVEFAIYKAETENTGYLKIDGITSPYETADNGLDIMNYTVTYVSNINEATKFKTNSSGKIVINNLEVYSAPAKKYNYYIREVSNNNYGYENISIGDVTVTGGQKVAVDVDVRQIQINLDTSDTIVEIINEKELVNLTIQKVGEGDINLSNVEFAIWQSGTGTNGWLKLGDETVIVTPDSGIDITEYVVTYVSDVSQATKFKTNSSGKVIINNLRMYVGKDQKFDYWLRETGADSYGYKGLVLEETDVTITGGISEEVNTKTRDVKVTVTDENVEVKVKNIPHLGGFEVTKVDKSNNNKVLPNVEFKVIVDENKYVQLKNANGEVIASVTGIVTINPNNKATGEEYAIEYIEDINKATILKTDSQGKIGINNLEVYSGVDSIGNSTKFTYKVTEASNSNYGYAVDKSSLENVTIELTQNSIQNKIIENEKFLAGLSIKKVDEEYPDIALDNVEFRLSMNNGTYIALYNENGFVEKAVGPIAINENNIANKSEYRVEYVANQENATKLLTNENGELLVNNLKVYDEVTAEKYTYKLTEIYNPHYGYEKPNEAKHYFETTLEQGQITAMSENLVNTQEYSKISGYVWVENPTGKSNGYNNVYTNNAENGDKVLKDLYLYTSAQQKLTWNANAEIPVKIELQDQNGNVIKDKPDAFDADGKYTFTDLKLEEFSNYKVVFIYDGLYYSTVVPNSGEDETITSKVKEVQEERNALSDKFSEVGANGAIGGQENVVTYDKEVANVATVGSISIDTSVSANTSETGINFADELDKLKKSPNTEPVEGIQNINMGLVVREQPDLGLFTDIEKVIVNVNGYDYSYVYATRNQYTENKTDIDVGVKFENEAYLTQRYTRKIYASDIQAAQRDENVDLSVLIMYKVTIVNESRTLMIAPKEIANYFDNRYTIESVVSASGVAVTYGEPVAYGNDTPYNVVNIGYNGILQAGQMDQIYITFNIPKDVVINDLAQNKSTYHNATEIIKYTSYYNNGTVQTPATGKDENGNPFTTDVYDANKGGNQLYAGIDEDSAPGNIEINLTAHLSGEGTPILDTSRYEDDEDSAPAFVLAIGEERTISGIVWEDTDADTTDNERLGNGKYDSGTEKLMANVQLELIDVATDEKAKYSNGEDAVAITNDRGEYTFGGNTTGEGILPGSYIIRYTYNNESYIVGGTNINALDYKSTIITSGVIESAITDITKDITYGGTNYPGDKWYLIDQGDRYSDAVDNMNIRKSMNEDSVIFKNYNELQTKTMEANTAIMEIGIEYTLENQAQVKEDGTGTTLALRNNLEQVDFGIIQRPKVDYTIDKNITSLEIVSQTGANIVPKGDPSNPGETMQGVKTGLEGVVEGEIDENLLQGATMKLEYEITVENNSEIDYTEESYYYYGRNGITVATVNIKKVVDYLDATVKLDPSQEQANKINGWLNDDGTEKTSTHTELAQSGLISIDVQNELKKGKHKIFINDQFEDIAVDQEKSVNLYVSKLLGVSDEINIYNDVEIIELSGGRTITSSIPGNYIPTHDGGLNGGNHENDDDRVKLLIVGPTGATTDYVAYTISIAVMLLILVGGIIIIRKTMKNC